MDRLRKIFSSAMVFVWICFVIVGIIFLRSYTKGYFNILTIFVSVNFTYLIIKIILSFITEDRILERDKDYSISVILPCYNESKEAVVRALECLLLQTYQVKEIFFIDDGSVSDETYLAVKELVDKPEFKDILSAIRFEENGGKKKAQEYGFSKCSGEIIMLYDSDGEMSETAVEEMVSNFNDEKVGAVVGAIVPRNASKNFLTRMQEILYTNSFQLCRRAQSRLGCVTVCSGALSMFRAEIIRENLELFSRERFFGIKCTTGDDRLLTMITLKEGYRTVYQGTAVCKTDVPEKVSKYFKQQVRWSKSGYIFSLYSLKYLYNRPFSIVFQMLESYLWLFNLVLLIISLFNGLRINLLTIVIAVIYSILVYYISCIYYARRNVIRYMYGFVYNFAYGILLCAIRTYALLTIRYSKWSTR